MKRARGREGKVSGEEGKGRGKDHTGTSFPPLRALMMHD